MFTHKKDQELVLNSSGKPGKNGQDGSHGQSFGAPGKPGKHGEVGESGQDISISLSSDPMDTSVKVGINASREELLPLGYADTAILVNTNGGDGGRGGDGGHGHKGYRGGDGQDATQYSYGTNGDAGGPGGNGGHGGHGGAGADAGNLSVDVADYDTDLLMLLDKPQLLGGIGGRGGQGGRGGDGGRGGSGGRSHTWIETVRHHRKDADGKCHTDTHHIPHHMPGGSNGSPGSAGSKGQDGFIAKSGKNGEMKIQVNGQGIYTGVYDLALDSYQEITSEDGIIEPGEYLKIKKIKFKNTGLMPTPSRQNISITLIPNNRIDFDSKDALKLPLSLGQGQIGALQEPLRFHVKPTAAIPTIDTAYHESPYFQFKATVERVNKSFKKIPEQLQTISVRYPVQLSAISLPPTISSMEEAPCVFAIKNISTKSLGLEAKDARLLEIQLEANSKNKMVSWHSLDEKTSYALSSPVHMAYPELKPNEIAYFKGTLRFTKDTPAYTQVNLQCKLNLGKLDQKTTQTETIQLNRASLQLADCYQYDAKADMILVTNNETDQKTVEHWREVAANLGTSLSVWNTSLYSGLSYTQKRADGKSFIDDMQGKVMVVLNNTMTIGSRRLHSTDCLDTMEIMKAAKQNNVSTYVVGSGFDIEKSIIPLQPLEEKKIEKAFEDKYYFWQHPSREDLINKAQKLKAAYQKQNPHQHYTTFYAYRARRKPSTSCFSFRSTWELGYVAVRESLDAVQSHIAYREQVQKPASDDVYTIVKLLPFNKKLEYIENSQGRYHDIIKAAILSDLAAEVLAFSKDKWNGDFSSKKLANVLTNLKAFRAHEFSNQKIFSDLLFNYEYFVRKIPTTCDRYFMPFLCRRTRLRNLCEEIINPLLSTHFSKTEKTERRKALEARFKDVSRSDLFENFLHPKSRTTRFDTDCDIEPQPYTVSERYAPKVSHFKENLHFFKNSAARQASIASYQSHCRFSGK